MNDNLVRVPYDCGSFSIEALQSHHINGIVDAICIVWPTSNLIIKELNINGNDMKPYATLLVERALKEDLSVVCINKKTKEIIGFVIVEDLNSPPLSNTNNLDERFKIWMEYTKQVESPYHEKYKKSNEKTIHVSMTGVKPGYEGLYLARLAMLLAMRRASDKGYNTLFSVLTHSGTQGIATDRNATELYRIEFANFTYNNTNPLANIELKSCSVIILQLSDHTDPHLYSKRMETLQNIHSKRYNASL